MYSDRYDERLSLSGQNGDQNKDTDAGQLGSGSDSDQSSVFTAIPPQEKTPRLAVSDSDSSGENTGSSEREELVPTTTSVVVSSTSNFTEETNTDVECEVDWDCQDAVF